MLLHQSTWQEVEAYLERSKGIVIPIGSTEQHGPNGLLGTDALCPEILAHEAAAEAGFLVAPTFNVGMAQHHLGFPGSISLRPSTMIAALQDWISSLAGHGFEAFYFLNGHGGNIATLDAAFSEYYAEASFRGEASTVTLKRRNWWELARVMETCVSLFPVGHGSHATASEVALTYYAYPGSVKAVEMTPKIAPDGTFTDAANFRQNFPDGRCGSDPSQATPELGAKIVARAKPALIAEVTAYFGMPSG